MTWWSWIIGGAVLLGAELLVVDAQFYLVFIGTAAILVGVALAGLPELPTWSQWAAFAVLAVVSMVGFRRRIYERLRGHAPAVGAGPAGGSVDIAEALAPGARCQVEHAGTVWTAQNAGHHAIAAGTRARIRRVEGLTLLVDID